ncbi:MAG: class I SAM-dependent methyltransferase [Terrimicrobiaceae bacterium]
MTSEFKLIDTLPMPSWWPLESELVAFFQEALPIHHFVPLTYKISLLKSLAQLFPTRPCKVLDLGAGDGLMATAIGKFFPITQISGVDVVERVHPKACLDFATYNGINLPFLDNTFDVVMTCNVLHHVPLSARSSLLAEVARVTRSTILIKDHLARGPWSRFSLGLADWVGNTPYGGMVHADYLDAPSWKHLLSALPFNQDWYHGLGLQKGFRNVIFPDCNEIVIRLHNRRGEYGN